MSSGAIERLHETARCSWDLAVHAGATRWEIFAKASSVEGLIFRPDPPVVRKSTDETGVAVRLLSGKEAGFGSASGLGPDAARAAILGAGNTLAEIPMDPLPPRHLLGVQELPGATPLPHRSWAREMAAQLSEALIAEAGARLFISELNFQQASYGWLLSTGDGFTATHEDSLISLALGLENRGGQRWRHEEWFWIPDADDFDPEKAAARIAGRCSLLNLPPVSREGLYDLLLDPEMSAHVAAALAPLFLPGPVDHLSALADRHGRLAAPCLRLVEDPSRADSPSRAPCDGEGFPSRSHLLLEAGVPRHRPSSYLESCLFGDPPQGGALRMSYRDRPRAGTSSLYLLAETTCSREELIPSRGWTLYLNRPLTPIKLDPGKDRFSFLASGTWLEGGKARNSQPLVKISGAISHFLQRVEAVGSDLSWYQTSAGFVAAPSVLIRCQRVMP